MRYSSNIPYSHYNSKTVTKVLQTSNKIKKLKKHEKMAAEAALFF